MKSFNEILELIESKQGIAFGSRVWGNSANDMSDYDYLLDIDNQQKIRSIMQEGDPFSIVDSDYYLNSYYIITNDNLKFNIVTYKKSVKDAWLGVIEMMKHAPDFVTNNKHNRQMIFETLLSLFKTLSKEI